MSRLETVGPLRPGLAGGVMLDGGTSRLYFRHQDSIAHDYGAEKLDRLVGASERPEFYAVDYRDIVFCRKVLGAIANDPTLFVDNDCGIDMPGDEFVRLISEFPQWDWRLLRGRPGIS